MHKTEARFRAASRTDLAPHLFDLLASLSNEKAKPDKPHRRGTKPKPSAIRETRLIPSKRHRASTGNTIGSVFKAKTQAAMHLAPA